MGAHGFGDCGLSPPIAFIAAHKLRLKYAMLIGRAHPAFSVSAAGGVLMANNVDLYLAWNGSVWCRVPIHSAINSAFGWVLMLDAPAAVGVKMPMLIGCALTPEQAPWNSWPAGEKRGKEVGDEQPDPKWLDGWEKEEVVNGAKVVKEWLAGNAASPPPPPVQPPTPPKRTFDPPKLVAPLPPPTPPPPPATPTPTPTDDDELPFDVPEDGPRSEVKKKDDPSPQLGLF